MQKTLNQPFTIEYSAQNLRRTDCHGRKRPRNDTVGGAVLVKRILCLAASAQSFAKGTTKTVTVLTDLSPNNAFQNPHMFEIIAGMEETLGAKGYRLHLRGVDADNAYEVAEEIISRRSADAIAIHVSVMTHPLAGLLTKLRFPHIGLGMPNFESQVCWIDNNNVYSGSIPILWNATQPFVQSEISNKSDRIIYLRKRKRLYRNIQQLPPMSQHGWQLLYTKAFCDFTSTTVNASHVRESVCKVCS